MKGINVVFSYLTGIYFVFLNYLKALVDPMH